MRLPAPSPSSHVGSATPFSAHCRVPSLRSERTISCFLLYIPLVGLRSDEDGDERDYGHRRHVSSDVDSIARLFEEEGGYYRGEPAGDGGPELIADGGPRVAHPRAEELHERRCYGAKAHALEGGEQKVAREHERVNPGIQKREHDDGHDGHARRAGQEQGLAPQAVRQQGESREQEEARDAGDTCVQ